MAKKKTELFISKTMGLAVCFLLFTIYLYGTLFARLYELEDISHPPQSIFYYVIAGIASAVIALIFASVSLALHPTEPGSVTNWWLTFCGFVLSLATFGIMFVRYIEIFRNAIL